MACLSGANGHGKSALLEAMTWALWGEARKGGGMAKPHRGLIRAGTTEMFVELVFDHEGHRYRVRRSYRLRASGGTVSLDLFGWDPDESAWRSLTLDHAAATEQRIVNLLRMDHETFQNSAYLRQGRADAFTRQQPSQRKQLLSDMLGLSRYERLRLMARDKGRRLDQELVAGEAEREALLRDLADRETIRERLEQLQGQVSGQQTTLDEFQTAAAALRDALAADSARRARQQDLQVQVSRIRSDLADLAAERKRLTELCDALVASLERKSALVQQMARYEALEQQRAECERQVGQRRKLESEVHRLESELQSLRREAETERRRLADQVEQLRKRLAEARPVLGRRERIRQQIVAEEARRVQLEAAERDEQKHRALSQQIEAVAQRVERARADLEANQRQVAEQAKEARTRADREPDLAVALRKASERFEAAAEAGRQLAAAEQRIADNTACFAALKARNETVSQRRQELETHQALLHDEDGQCPVCHSPLSAGRLAQVKADFGELRESLDAEAATLRVEGRQLKQDKLALAEEAAALRRQAEQQTSLQRDVDHIERDIAEARAAAQEHERLATRSIELKSSLAAGEYGGEDAAQLRRLRRERDALVYEPDQLAALRRAMSHAAEVAREQQLLEQAERDEALVKQDLPPLEAALAALDLRLAEQQVGQDEAAALKAVREQLEPLSATEEQLAAIDAERRELADVPRQLQRVEDAEARLPEERARLADVESKLVAREQMIKTAEAEAEELTAALLDRETAEPRLRELDEAVGNLRSRLATEREELGRLQAVAERQVRQQAELKELETKQSEVRRRRTVLADLEQAFGRDGIPALIIENVVPEIEQHANELLDRLTGGRMHLAIRLQKLLQSGGERDTLEIEISDELGTRSYENYSGGEAFRVDFALRLALSRLLAGRAGARLRTLIIDEGFGTQDEEGIEQLVEAIHAVRDEFDLVLVVTHLNSLKERFATRIEIYKEPDTGSTFQVVGVGEPFEPVLTSQGV